MPANFHAQGRHGQRPGGGGGPGGRGGQGDDRQRRVADLLKKPASPERYHEQHSAREGGELREALRTELVDEEAERVARQLARIPATQLRRFYAAVLAIKRQVEVDRQVPDEDLVAKLHLLRAKAAYTYARLSNRDTGPAYEELVRFFTRHAASVRTKPDFRGFCQHFEAVMAFHRCFEEKQGRS